MVLPSILLGIAGGATSSAATNLYVASYSGSITSLSLSSYSNGTYNLANVFTTNASAPSPSWLTLDKANNILYSIDEGLTTPNGSVTSLSTSSDGILTHIERAITIPGGVSSVIYNSSATSRALAIAHYGGSALSTWSINTNGTFTPLQNFTFSLLGNGSNPSRQEASHPHQAIVDPTGWYIIVPDLGADMIRIFCSDPSGASDLLEEHAPLKVATGSGPRHAAFWSPNTTTTAAPCPSSSSYDKRSYIKTTTIPLYMYVVSELANTVTGFAVTYSSTPAGGLSFRKVYTSSTSGSYGNPIDSLAAEIAITPDNAHILISNRDDGMFNIPNPNPRNSSRILSDSVAVWSPLSNGTLDFVQLYPAGGSSPRQFSINKAGDLVAVALQSSEMVVILRRDVKTGRFGGAVAEIGLKGPVTTVIWDE